MALETERKSGREQWEWWKELSWCPKEDKRKNSDRKGVGPHGFGVGRESLGVYDKERAVLSVRPIRVSSSEAPSTSEVGTQNGFPAYIYIAKRILLLVIWWMGGWPGGVDRGGKGTH